MYLIHERERRQIEKINTKIKYIGHEAYGGRNTQNPSIINLLSYFVCVLPKKHFTHFPHKQPTKTNSQRLVYLLLHECVVQKRTVFNHAIIYWFLASIFFHKSFD